jgi:hypothetical protein
MRRAQKHFKFVIESYAKNNYVNYVNEPNRPLPTYSNHESLINERRGKSNFSSKSGFKQGCQIFLATTYQNGENVPHYLEI